MKFFSDKGECVACSINCLQHIVAGRERHQAVDNVSVLTLEEGDTVMKQGSFVSQVAFLQEGVVKKVLEGKNDKNVILKIIEPQTFLALPELLKADRYPFSFVAVTGCKVCFIKRDWLNKIILKEKKAQDFLLNSIAREFNFMYGKLTTTCTRNSYGKLASALLYLTSEVFHSDVLNLLNRKELSELSATSKESTNKILQQMHHDGIIKITKDSIKVARRDLLEKLSTVG
ncbi:Crp/Fnr family transcriptional regulator [Carboxylicivirga taeanensis]|uniref:Crp/Fnr family transcriptional regulator n=1 Tax=Carboxylicivirga taeanensis TaxID=1416875 RepID=UPI003F6DDD3D